MRREAQNQDLKDTRVWANILLTLGRKGSAQETLQRKGDHREDEENAGFLLKKKTTIPSREWWHTPITPALRRLRQEDQKMETSSG